MTLKKSRFHCFCTSNSLMFWDSKDQELVISTWFNTHRSSTVGFFVVKYVLVYIFCSVIFNWSSILIHSFLLWSYVLYQKVNSVLYDMMWFDKDVVEPFTIIQTLFHDTYSVCAFSRVIICFCIFQVITTIGGYINMSFGLLNFIAEPQTKPCFYYCLSILIYL